MVLDIKNINQKLKQERNKSENKFNLVEFLNKDYQLFNKKKFTDQQKENFYSELYILLSSGIDIKVSLELISEQQKKKKERKVVEDIIQGVKDGLIFSEAVKNSEGFSDYEYHSIRIGEESGKLVEVVKQIWEYYNNKIKQKRKVISALSYPIFVLIVTFVVVAFMLMFIVPMFEDIFLSFEGELPQLTKIIINISENFLSIFLILLSIVIFVYFFIKINKNNVWYRRITSQLILKIPVVGQLTHKVNTSRFCQSMALLLSADIPVIRVLQLVQKMIRFYPIEYALEEVGNMVYKGMLLNQGFARFPVFEQKLVTLVKVAEEVNKLDEVFERLYVQYSNEVEHRLNMLNSLMEPLMIIIVGFFVAIILISMYMPLFHLSTTVF